ncbi:MAG: hypothetical protein WCT49_04620 [Candidatus Paceibacterota bacterium]|nr:hypothetical protein [Candidatus Paceibacterota bacterium]
MNKKFSYLLLYGVPGSIISLILSGLVSGGILGILWLFVFGDDSWPAWVEYAIIIVFLATFLTSWIFIVQAGYSAGKKMDSEGRTAFSRKHILISSAITAFFLLMVLLHQSLVGNIGSSDDLACENTCSAKGYSGSSESPKDSGIRKCECFDPKTEQWKEVQIAK